MSALVLILGVVATLTGIAAIGFGIPNGDSTVGNAAIIAGTTMLVGGLVLIGLSAAIGQLRRIADGLSARAPAPRAGRGEIPEAVPVQPAYIERPPAMVEAPVAADAGPGAARIPFPTRPSPRTPPPEPPIPEQHAEEPPPQRAPLDVSAHAFERLRSNIGRASQRPTEPASPPVSPAPPPFVRQGRMPPLRGGNGSVQMEEERAFTEPPPERDFEPERSAPPYAEEAPAADSGQGEPRARPGLFDSLWPPEPRSARPRSHEPADRSPPMAPPKVGAARPEREVESATFPPPQPVGHHPAGAQQEADRPASGGEVQAVAILKSGVVDGMAYTLYTDGSIEAQLASGTVRFASIGELRAHLDQNAQS
jgi:hypothetical protein